MNPLVRSPSVIARSLVASLGFHGLVLASIVLGGLTLFYLKPNPPPPTIYLESRLEVNLPVAEALVVEVVAPAELIPDLLDSPPEAQPVKTQSPGIPDFRPQPVKPTKGAAVLAVDETAKPLVARPAPLQAQGFTFTPPQVNPKGCSPPRYPGQAVRRGWEGTVLVRVKVNALGFLDEVVLEKKSGYAILDKEALAAISDWKLEPAYWDGHPVGAYLLIPVRFRLSSQPNF
ncbi:MAG TPA: hypothetical protein DDW23_07150 [Planctomycetes bacterium]|nr:hypothetical protein [Planctomycetota bacterium]